MSVAPSTTRFSSPDAQLVAVRHAAAVMARRPPAGPIRVLLVAADRPYAEGLMTMLVEDERLDVIGSAETVGVAVKLAASLRPDAVVIRNLPSSLDGFEATRLIHETLPSAVIVFVGETEDAERAREAGALCIVREDEVSADLLTIVIALSLVMAVSTRLASKSRAARRLLP
jgi:DNA-binding NarL/FixJ family response regulator